MKKYTENSEDFELNMSSWTNQLVAIATIEFRMVFYYHSNKISIGIGKESDYSYICFKWNSLPIIVVYFNILSNKL